MLDSPNLKMPEQASIDTMAAAMVERFGEGAIALATDQLAAAHTDGDAVADRWLSIFLSIEDRLGRGGPETLLGDSDAQLGSK